MFRVLSVVEAEEAVRPLLQSLLGRTVIAPDLAAAGAAWRECGGAFDFVTPGGRTARPARRLHRRLRRRKRIGQGAGFDSGTEESDGGIARRGARRCRRTSTKPAGAKARC